MDWKSYNFNSFNTNTFFTEITITNNGVPQVIRSKTSFGEPPVHKSVEYFPISFGLSASRPDKWGVIAVDLNNSFNFMETHDGAFRQAAGNKDATPRYYIASGGVTRDWNLPGEIQIHTRLEGQWASSPLINNEQFGSGGITGVRGYRDGQIYSDSGWRMMLEPR